MKKSLLAVTLALTSLGFGASGDVQCEGDHHFYFGLDSFVVRDSYRDFPYNDTKNAFLGGFTGGYEFLEPRNFYFCINGSYCKGYMETSSSRIFPTRKVYDHRKMTVVHKNLECRLGYNFEVETGFMLTPYVSIGDQYRRAITCDKVPGQRSSIGTLYIATGFRSYYAASESTKIGFNFKRYHTMKEENFSNCQEQFLTPLNGGHEISFAWATTYGKSETFVIKLEPYVKKENIHSGELTFGSTLLISCDF